MASCGGVWNIGTGREGGANGESAGDHGVASPFMSPAKGFGKVKGCNGGGGLTSSPSSGGSCGTLGSAGGIGGGGGGSGTWLGSVARNAAMASTAQGGGIGGSPPGAVGSGSSGTLPGSNMLSGNLKAEGGSSGPPSSAAAGASSSGPAGGALSFPLAAGGAGAKSSGPEGPKSSGPEGPKSSGPAGKSHRPEAMNQGRGGTGKAKPGRRGASGAQGGIGAKGGKRQSPKPGSLAEWRRTERAPPAPAGRSRRPVAINQGKSSTGKAKAGRRVASGAQGAIGAKGSKRESPKPGSPAEWRRKERAPPAPDGNSAKTSNITIPTEPM